MLVRRRVLDRHPVQNGLVALALGIVVFMFAPPVSPIFGEESIIPFLASSEPNTLSAFTVEPLPEDFEPKRRPAPVKVKGVLMSGYTAGGSRFDEVLAL